MALIGRPSDIVMETWRWKRMQLTRVQPDLSITPGRFNCLSHTHTYTRTHTHPNAPAHCMQKHGPSLPGCIALYLLHAPPTLDSTKLLTQVNITILVQHKRDTATIWRICIFVAFFLGAVSFAECQASKTRTRLKQTSVWSKSARTEAGFNNFPTFMSNESCGEKCNILYL